MASSSLLHEPLSQIDGGKSAAAVVYTDQDRSDSPPYHQGDGVSLTPADEKRLRLKIDLRLCTIAGILCSLDLLDSG